VAGVGLLTTTELVLVGVCVTQESVVSVKAIVKLVKEIRLIMGLLFVSCQMSVVSCWLLVVRLWSLDFGLWSLVFGLWSLVFGLWSSENIKNFHHDFITNTLQKVTNLRIVHGHGPRPTDHGPRDN
jgi:hypothetical protein